MSHKVLVVDDNLAVQRLISTILSGEGLDVVSVSTGPAALSVLQSEKGDIPDLILADFNLEGIHLFTFVRQVHQDDRLAQVPIIALIHSIHSYDPLNLALMGIHAVLKKPISTEALLETVRTRMQSSVPKMTEQGHIQAGHSSSPGNSFNKQKEVVPDAMAASSPVVQLNLLESDHCEISSTIGQTIAMESEQGGCLQSSVLADVKEGDLETSQKNLKKDPLKSQDAVVEMMGEKDVIQAEIKSAVGNAVNQVIRQVLPGLLEAVLTKDMIRTTLERVVREVVLPLAEDEIMKEIKRLQPEEVF